MHELRGKPEIINLECPFCKKEAVKAIYYPPVLQAATSSSAAAGRKTKFYRTKEKYEIISDCKNCEKSKKEIEKALKEGSKIDFKKKIEELKKAGLPTTITSVIKE